MSQKVVKSEESRPCGCRVVNYSDDTSDLTPCPPCALGVAANGLNQAAVALQAASVALRNMLNRPVMLPLPGGRRPG